MIVQAICTSAKRAFLSGVHKASDRYMLALYTEAADIGPDTEAYTTEGEVSGDGYTRGGRELRGWTVTITGMAAQVRFEPVEWSNATIAARGALVYNDTAPGVPAVAVLDFGREVKAVNGPFTVRLDEADALITWF